MSSVQDLTAIGKEMGLTGEKLNIFVKEQQTLQREERAAQRAHEKEQNERLLRLEAEKLAADAKDKEMRERERDKDRAFEVERMKHDLEKERLQVQLRRIESNSGTRQGSDNEQEAEGTNDAATQHQDQQGRRSTPKGPKITPFSEADEIDSYLHRFEQYATAQRWERANWAVYLAALLKGKALDVYARLPTSQANDYDVLKDSLLKRYNKTEEGYKQLFHTCKAEPNEAPRQFIVRLQSYLTKWIQLAKVNETFEGLQTLIVREQFLRVCSKELEVFLRERAITDLIELAAVAEQYLDAHKRGNLTVVTPARVSTPSVQPAIPEPKRCYNCNRPGHLARNCRQPIKAAGLETETEDERVENYEMEATAGMEPVQGRTTFNRPNTGGYYRPPMNAYRQPYRETTNNRYDDMRQQQQQQQPQQPPPPQPVNAVYCKAHNLSMCRECLNFGDFPKHPACTALLIDQVELKCGCTLPIIADACQAAMGRTNMPTSSGSVNNKAVTVLRDSGCSTIVVRRALVSADQLTGHERVCVLIDGTVRRNPTARIDIDTPYLKGNVTAVCMTNPLYDLIIGNVPGIVETPDVVQAVTTRGMAVKQALPPQALPVPSAIDLDISRTDLASHQRNDATLSAFFAAVNADNDRSTGNTPTYVVKHDLLYRRTKDERGRECTQLMVPTTRLREQVMKVAHESAFGGHQGINRTKLRISAQFWWPMLSADVARFCKSCDICQHTISRGRIPNVPLGAMPIIETPFDRVAIDLVGPIAPASERGHRYILTVVDYATRYPEAVALKDIFTITVAEALVDTFSRVGIPKEILSDQGSQFVSDVMKEVSRLLSIKQLVTTPYHPMCNGLVERFNGTIKTMLKRVCCEKPKEWDRYLSAVLFAYREIRQESLGYSPFELLYGRSVRGPMAILKELWTKEQLEPEVKTTYQYVIDLQTRLQETCKLAAEELRKAQEKQTKQFNKKAVYRLFTAGSKVLILRPTDHNKLLMQWKGPYEVIEHVRDHNYRINVKGRARLYHANMLKQFIERKSSSEANVVTATMLEIDENEVEMIAAAILEASGEEDSEMPTYQPLQKETWVDVDINPALTDDKQQQVRELLREFADIFTDVPKRSNVGEHQIHLTTNDPVYQKPYPLPFALREALSQEIDVMLRLQVIEPSTSPYASPVVMVKKPDNAIRVCIDYRRLNKITVFDPEPMPTADEIFAKLANDRYFSKFDLSKGYWQIPMADAHKPFTSFTTHRGMFQFNTMPFGLVNAPATFSRIMRQVLHAAENLDNYLDDVLAHTSDWNKQLRALRELFTRLRASNLAVRPTKCSIGYTRVEFLGFEIGDNRLQPIARKVEKVMIAPKPTTKAQLRSFLGLIGYYRRFIPNFATLAVPLTDLTKKAAPNALLWHDVQENAFNALRSYLTNPPVLHLPNFQKPFILQTDACREGTGAVLLQEYDGIRYPIAFASRKLLPREQNYSTIEQECLAIVWAIQKFSDYLYGRQFVLETDHHPLQYLTQACYQNGRLMRWALALQPYSYTVRAIKGSQNVGADFLSRHAA